MKQSTAAFAAAVAGFDIDVGAMIDAGIPDKRKHAATYGNCECGGGWDD